MNLTNPARALIFVLAAYVVLDILLTPPAGIETRPVSHVTGVGFVTLGLLFVGLALSIVSLVLLFRGSPRAPAVAIVAAILFYPAVFAELTGHFSSVPPPTRIASIELVQSVVALIVIAISLWMLRPDTTRSG
ncbi:MAG TPA: hypothetical protein VLR46_13250 [Candidatus Dormibacteraeota bacterium]|nr:hypothetical protein [Candidatus Dormibacteraeota bacterium]